MTPWLLLLTLAAPPDVQADFTAANDRALQGDARGAIALYESLCERGVRNADVLYNLGNAYAANDQLIEAVVAYERARLIDPSDADLASNLAIVRKRLAPDVAATDVPDAPLTVSDAFAPWAKAMPSPVAAALLIIGHALFWVGWWYERRRLPLLITGASLAVLGGLFAIAHSVVDSDQIGVVVRGSTLREGPRPQFRAAGTAAAGARVRIIDNNGTWREVQQDDGTTGWLQLKDITLL